MGKVSQTSGLVSRNVIHDCPAGTAFQIELKPWLSLGSQPDNVLGPEATRYKLHFLISITTRP